MPFGKLRKLPLRELWGSEPQNFTPWLEQNITALGETLGIDLELETREASVGNFSLDLLARNLGTDEYVIIENQLTQTDHDHLGKLLTYAAGFTAETVIWVAESIRDEHRQALDWLNQRTDSKTNFFAVIIEVFQIDNSRPAYKFRPIVFPNEWQKNKKRQIATSSPRAEAYRAFFQLLIDDLREKYRFTTARIGQAQNWYSFASGFTGYKFSASFTQYQKVRVELYLDALEAEKNKKIFDQLLTMKDAIETQLKTPLEWERLDDNKASRICVYQHGHIEQSAEELEKIQQWMTEYLLAFKKIFFPLLKEIIPTLKEIKA